MRLTCASLLVATSLSLVSGQQLPNGDSYDAAEARLKNGREYRKTPTGRVSLPTTVRGVALDNVLEVPGDYDPSRRWPLRVSLHGGVGRTPPGPNDPPARPLTNRAGISGELVLHPRAWSGLEWWNAAQVENIERLVDRIKRDYNVDESRIYVTGISDGGTGVYFLAMRAATPWAACLPLNGHPLVLANPDSGTDGILFSSNLANCPLHVVNGGRDPLYPAASVAPLVAMFRRGGIPVDFQVYPDAGHDVSWWPQERPGYEAFLAAHRRVPHPARITWETERTDRYNRFRWLVIDRLGARGSDRPLVDINRFVVGNGREQPLFARGRQSGRVDVTRRGNTFDAETRGVTAFTLLLSPDVIDFAKPIRVSVNGHVVFDGAVAKSVDALRNWAGRDNDRTMLYGAELKVSVP
jgi:poly(3-hydroxybutyrate) depolymerase